MLTREQFLGRKPKRHTVEVPELDGAVIIQALTVGAAQAIKPDQGLVDLIIASVINEDGTPMFSPEDHDALLRLEFSALKRIGEAVSDFNGLSTTAVEDLAKNSETGLNGASSSG
jgi:hypothetical protein